jgi:hypothetical protein
MEAIEHALRVHYKRYIQAKLYHTMEFAEYLSDKIDIPVKDAYAIIKNCKPSHV